MESAFIPIIFDKLWPQMNFTLRAASRLAAEFPDDFPQGCVRPRVAWTRLPWATNMPPLTGLQLAATPEECSPSPVSSPPGEDIPAIDFALMDVGSAISVAGFLFRNLLRFLGGRNSFPKLGEFFRSKIGKNFSVHLNHRREGL